MKAVKIEKAILTTTESKILTDAMSLLEKMYDSMDMEGFSETDGFIMNIVGIAIESLEEVINNVEEE